MPDTVPSTGGRLTSFLNGIIRIGRAFISAWWRNFLIVTRFWYSSVWRIHHPAGPIPILMGETYVDPEVTCTDDPDPTVRMVDNHVYTWSLFAGAIHRIMCSLGAGRSRFFDSTSRGRFGDGRLRCGRVNRVHPASETDHLLPHHCQPKQQTLIWSPPVPKIIAQATRSPNHTCSPGRAPRSGRRGMLMPD